MKTTKCTNCIIENNNMGLAQHRKACDGLVPAAKFVKLGVCPHCLHKLNTVELTNRANHVRWCIQHPKLESYAKFANCDQLHTIESAIRVTRSPGISLAATLH